MVLRTNVLPLVIRSNPKSGKTGAGFHCAFPAVAAAERLWHPQLLRWLG